MIHRAFQYGDLAFESIRVENGKALFLTRHFNRIKFTCHQLQFQSDWLTFEWFKNEIDVLIQSLLVDVKYRIRFIVFRDGGGFYQPLHHTTQFQFQFEEIHSYFPFINKLGVYPENYKACTPLSNLKTGNALIYVLSSIWAKANELDDVIILNEHKRVVESSSSNIFILKKGKLYTPPLTEACVAGVYREAMLEILPDRGIFCEEIPLNVSDILDADEIFVSNSIRGIRPIKHFEGKTYESVMTGHIQHIMAENEI